MKCPKCQCENPDSAKFCNECAYDLKLAEDPISYGYTQPTSYTPKHLADKILTTRSAIEGERKMVTVLFADVADYTSMAEKLDPETVHQIMDGCFKILMDEIHDHEGTINQFTGDGVMALFGAPIAHEEHAQKACYAAIAIQESLQKYRQQLKDKFGVDFNMRIGINSGPVVVGSIGDDLRMDYTAIGDTTNLAARMESSAQSGTVLVSKHTYEKVTPFFDFEALAKYEVKGKKEQQEAYRLTRQKDRSHLGFTRQIYSEMVGRDAELNKLELQVLKAVDGQGSIVNVIGEAGIGKSRLIAELKQTSVIKKVALREGKSISMGKGLSFYPVIDIYKNWAKIKEGDSDAAAISKLEASIRAVTPQDVNEILPFTATLMGIKLTGRYAERVKGIEGEGLEKLILKSVKDLLIKSSELIPIVIVIEDLHWADLSTIELLESLFRLTETHKILFINVFRPRYTETGVRIVQTVKEKFPDHYVEIELQPLNEQMSETLINNMLNISGLPHGVRDRIVVRSGGNPFFIEEVVRSFIDDGVILRKNGEFEVTEKIDSVVIPQSINDVLIARIDRLEEKTKDLVKTASVIGRSFFHRILAEVLKTFDDMDNRLEYLKEIQLIRDRFRLEELEYLFKHALTQEAAYDSLLVQKRKELHHKVAESIERVFKEKIHEFYGMLAYHYSKSENIEKAEEYMVKSGEEALRSSALSEALDYYQDALKLYLNRYGDGADPEKLAMFEKNIALAYFYKGEYSDALNYFDSLLFRWKMKPPSNKIAVFLKFLFDFLRVLKEVYFPSNKSKLIPDSNDNEFFDISYKKAITLVFVNPTRNFTEQMGTIRKSFRYDLSKINNGYIMPLSGSGLFSYTGFSFKLSNKFLEYAERVVDEDNFKQLFELKYYSLLHNCWSGDWEKVKGYDDFLVNQNLKIGQFWEVVTFIYFYAMVLNDKGEFLSVKLEIEKLAKIAEEYNSEYAKNEQFVLESYYYLQIRQFDKAQKSLENAILTSNKMGSDPMILSLLGTNTEIHILAEDFEEARNSLDQGESIYKKQTVVPPLYACPYLTSRFHFDIIMLEKSIASMDTQNISKYRKLAKKSYKMALNNARKYSILSIKVFRLIGIYYWIIGKPQNSFKWWIRAISEGKRLSALPDLGRTYMEIGKRLTDKKGKYKELNGINPEKYMEMAREIFENMDLQWDLDELDKIVFYGS
jgi:class 3 adenylate cyclase/tetratricopeptide (TPR) repeat protein